jgi:hypothetical protein
MQIVQVNAVSKGFGPLTVLHEVTLSGLDPGGGPGGGPGGAPGIVPANDRTIAAGCPAEAARESRRPASGAAQP